MNKNEEEKNEPGKKGKENKTVRTKWESAKEHRLLEQSHSRFTDHGGWP